MTDLEIAETFKVDPDSDKFSDIKKAYHIPLMRVLTDRGIEYCDAREHHEYQPCLATASFVTLRLQLASRVLDMPQPTT